MSHPNADARWDLVLEGICPYGTPLERRDDYGYCPDCRLGWRSGPDSIGIVLIPRAPAVFRKPST